MHYLISKGNWDKILGRVIQTKTVIAPLLKGDQQEYYPLDREQDISRIVYNQAKPSSPLKTFFLPVRENVVLPPGKGTDRIIMGIPACDLAGLDVLDKFYLEEPYVDPYYLERRNRTLLIGTDCFTAQEHCHCHSYGLDPYPGEHADIRLSVNMEEVCLSVLSKKGEDFLAFFPPEERKEISPEEANRAREASLQLKKQLEEQHPELPGYERTGVLIGKSTEDIWKKYAADCVSCGACAAICPTCTCFLLVDRPGFEKVRQLDTCQYPGFERVAAGEDPLQEKWLRFKNRYLCKYVWRPERHQVKACTGCGRCIEACIGRINKNELFLELTL